MDDRQSHLLSSQKGEQKIVDGIASFPLAVLLLVASSAHKYFLFVERQHGTIVHSFQKATARA
jgi:hypothetical protein